MRIVHSCLVTMVIACAGRSSAQREAPTAEATATPPDGAVSDPVRRRQGVDLPALATFEPASDTLAGVREQFGQLVGTWSCQGESRQSDGTFKPGPGRSRWTFFYTLGAQAIGDVFEPPEGSGGAVGINLRVYDPETDTWALAWTTPKLKRYHQFEARQEGDTLVMRGEIPANGPYGDHAARITFFEISDTGFEWRYEASAPGGEGPWQEFSRIHCEAAASDPAT